MVICWRLTEPSYVVIKVIAFTAQLTQDRIPCFERIHRLNSQRADYRRQLAANLLNQAQHIMRAFGADSER